MKRNAFIISLLSFFCMTTQAQQIEIFEPAMMEVEYNKRMKLKTVIDLEYLDIKKDIISLNFLLA